MFPLFDWYRSTDGRAYVYLYDVHSEAGIWLISVGVDVTYTNYWFPVDDDTLTGLLLKFT